ncbi:MAG: glycosyltransferase family 4 protein [Prevotella sp.]|nr:glycosyltransferase family 4 protein [Prevotella sp.]
MTTHNLRKKILFVLHTPPPVHGAAIVGKTIQDSVGINEAFDCHYINLSTSTTVETVGKFSLSKIGSVFNLRNRIMVAISQFHPDLVYYTPSATGFAFWKDFFITQSIKRTATPLIFHFHNKGVSTKQNMWLYDRAFRRFFSDTKVILLAESLYNDMKKYVSRNQLYICANGIADIKRREVSVHKHSVPHLLFLSNLIKEKGVFVFLDACQQLVAQGEVFRCNIVGSETEEIDGERIRHEISNRGLSGIVEYLGRKYGDEKEFVYADANIFVFPTFYAKECFPIVLLEAMQHGLPCISTCEGGIADIVENEITGLLVEHRNTGDLAEKMSLLINNPALCERMGEAGRMKYKRLYTLSSFEERMINILDEG